LDEAKIIIERLRALTPVVLPNADNWRDPEQREFYLSGLRLAMSATDEAVSRKPGTALDASVTG
jgi:adenylate cyclase